MKVKIICSEDNSTINATIEEVAAEKMPNMQSGWRFNFDEHVKRKNCKGYVLCTEQSTTMIEGAMVFEMKNGEQPMITYLEVASHNQKPEKKYLNIAGCLIAYAFRQTFIQAKGEFQGYLSIDISEEDPKVRDKLMANYSNQYNAVWNKTEVFNRHRAVMLIADEAGENLVEKYLT